MREEGLIDLDRPLASYLTLADAASDERTRAVTARHVLSHSTGFPNWRNKRDQQLTSDFTPGDRFGYSGEGFVYLQRAVERITGGGIEAFVQERVLAPLGMRHSSYFWRPEYDAHIVTGHNRGNPTEGRKIGRRLYEHAAKGPQPAPNWTYDDMIGALSVVEPPLAPLPNFIVPNVAGSLLTTAGDYGRFLSRVVGPPRGDGFDLTPEMRRDMLSPRTKINDVLSWGLGWGLERDGGREYLWHWGDNGDYKNFTIAEPARRAGLVVLTNSSTGMRLCERVVNAATGHDHPAFLWV
jgi:CubicO group peptidase (beta-lactamase class C family)